MKKYSEKSRMGVSLNYELFLLLYYENRDKIHKRKKLRG